MAAYRLRTEAGKAASRGRTRGLFIAVIAVFACACGHRTDIRPPSLVAPEAIDDLALRLAEDGVTLEWGRPRTYADGTDMEDLGGFVVLRASRDGTRAQRFQRIALLPVNDRDRFQQEKRFRYADTNLSAGTLYRYRVLAVTLDGYLGETSNTVEVLWPAAVDGA